jgi:HAD superfamily hydrolase (TIGR01509 family)
VPATGRVAAGLLWYVGAVRQRAVEVAMSGAELAAVVFDLDGVLIDSEQVWAEVREELARERGGRWPPDAARRMMGMSSPEWSGYMADELAVPMTPEDISAEVVERVAARYRAELPLLPGAVAAVRRLAGRWPLGLASSANRPLIDLVLEVAGLADAFAATVSSEEVDRGKPAPDVYLEASARLGVEPGRCAAVEDSANGIRAALAAGMRVVAVPNRAFPPPRDVLDQADLVVADVNELRPELLEGLPERT